MASKLNQRNTATRFFLWEYDDDWFPIVDLQQYVTMNIKDFNNKLIVKIKYVPAHREHKYLGHAKCMNGQNKLEHQNLTMLIKHEQVFFCSNFLNHYETAIYYKSIYIQKILFI